MAFVEKWFLFIYIYIYILLFKKESKNDDDDLIKESGKQGNPVGPYFSL